jgi:trehalose-6-phosphate synthase
VSALSWAKCRIKVKILFFTNHLTFFRRGDLAILYQGRNILLKIGHIGIESDKIKEITETPLFKEELENFKKLFHDKYVIASVDKMSALSGIKYKLKGFREFMRPAPGKKIVLVQVKKKHNNL